jgi:hypothetical protein
MTVLTLETLFPSNWANQYWAVTEMRRDLHVATKKLRYWRCVALAFAGLTGILSVLLVWALATL